MISPKKIRFRNKTNIDYDVIVDCAFESGDSGETESYLNREAITTETYDGSYTRNHGYKYTDTLVATITFIKKDFAEFTPEENRRMLSWLTSARNAERLEIYHDDSEVLSYVLFGGFTSVQQYKVANSRVAGYVCEFTHQAPFAYSPTCTAAPTRTIVTELNPEPFYYKPITVNCKTDEEENPIYPKITITFDDNKPYVYTSEYPMNDTFEMMQNVIYRYFANNFVRAMRPYKNEITYYTDTKGTVADPHPAAVQGEIHNIAQEYNALVNGNVDYSERPFISKEVMQQYYPEFDGDVATTYDADYFAEDANGTIVYTIKVTPILTNGSVMNQNEVSGYVQHLTDIVYDGGTLNDVLDWDRKNDRIVINIADGETTYNEDGMSELDVQLDEIKQRHTALALSFNDTIYYWKPNTDLYFINIAGSKKSIGIFLDKVTNQVCDNAMVGNYYYDQYNHNIYKGTANGWELAATMKPGAEIKITHVDEYGVDTTIKSVIIGCAYNEVITIDGANRLIFSDRNISTRVIGNDFNWEWPRFMCGENTISVVGNCDVQFEWVEPRKVGQL